MPRRIVVLINIISQTAYLRVPRGMVLVMKADGGPTVKDQCSDKW